MDRGNSSTEIVIAEPCWETANSAHAKVAEGCRTKEAFDTVGVNNCGTYRGNHSDGEVAWTVKKVFAVCFLAIFYTSAPIPVYFISASLTFIEMDGMASNSVNWLPTMNTLAVASIAPFVGYLEDVLGKRHITLFGASLICIGNILMVSSQQITQLSTGMILCGIGGGIAEQTGIAGFAEAVPVKFRGYCGAILVSFSLPFSPYIMYSQLLSTSGPDPTWRWGIWICFGWSATALAGLAICYSPRPYAHAERPTTADVIRRIDFTGGVLSITSITLILLALHAGSTTHPWTSAYTLCTFLIGIALLGAWVVWEWKFARFPMVPRELFQAQRAIGLAFVVAFVAGMNFLAVLAFWPLIISKIWHAKPVINGLRALPVTIATAVGGICGNSLLSVWTGGHRYVLFVGALIMTVFGGSLASVNPNNVLQSIVLATFAAFGVGSVIIPAAVAAVIVSPDTLITTCAALTVSIRALGSAVGYSIYYSIWQQKLQVALPAFVEQYAIQAGIPAASVKSFVTAFIHGPPESASSIPGVTPAVIAAAVEGSQWAYAQSLQYVWYTSIAFGACATICALCIPNTKAYQTNRVAVAL